MVQTQNSILKLKLVRLELIESNLIPHLFKLLINLVTPILECADIRVLNLVFLSVFYDYYVEVRRVLG